MSRPFIEHVRIESPAFRLHPGGGLILALPADVSAAFGDVVGDLAARTAKPLKDDRDCVALASVRRQQRDVYAKQAARRAEIAELENSKASVLMAGAKVDIDSYVATLTRLTAARAELAALTELAGDLEKMTAALKGKAEQVVGREANTALRAAVAENDANLREAEEVALKCKPERAADLYNRIADGLARRDWLAGHHDDGGETAVVCARRSILRRVESAE